MTTLEKIRERGINHAIGCSNIFPGMIGFEGQDWFILIKREDKKLAKGLRFTVLESDIRILIKDMTEKDKRAFKVNQEDYTPAKKTKYGKIYELKNKSFKDENK